ncbi:hypothetical protein Tco_0428768, partial [Tanacetum coccineum]
ANEVLVTKGALQSEVGHLDMLEHEVGSLCDEYAWWKLTRRCWNTHVLAAAIQEEKEIMWPIFVPWNVMSLHTTVLAQQSQIRELQSADCRRQTVITEMLAADHKGQKQLTEALKLIKRLQT